MTRFYIGDPSSPAVMIARPTLLGSTLALTIVVGAIASCAGGTELAVTTPSAATSTVSVSAPSVASGNDVTVTLRARDEAGANLTGGGATVAFALAAGGTSNGTFGSVTDHGNGLYTAPFTGTIAGSARSISATLNGAAVTTVMPTITTIPGPPSLSQSVVEVSTSTLQAGQTATLTLRARDAAGNPHTSGGLGVAFTKGSGTSDGTISGVADQGNGTYTATFTATLVGSARSFGATINDAPVTSTAPTITVFSSGPAPSVATSIVTVTSATVGLNGTVTIRLVTKDDAGNELTTGGRAVAFTKGSGTSDGTISAVVDNFNGTYSATFTGTTAGSARSIGATIGGIPVTTPSPTITVTAAAASPATSVVTTNMSHVASGSSVTATLQARDAGGANLLVGGATVVFSVTGAGTSTVTIGTVTDHANGTYSAPLTGVLAGSARTVSATINGATITTMTPSITVVPGPISAATSEIVVASASIVAGASTTVTLQGKDAAGNNQVSGNQVVGFGLGGSGTSAGTFSVTMDNGNGTYTATFTGTVAGTARLITAHIDGTPVTTASPTITVTAAAVSPATSIVTTSASTVQSGGTLTLTLQAKDASGTNINNGGATVAFSLGSGTSTGNIGAVTDHGNGTYTAPFTAVLAGTARAIAATVNGVAVTTAQPTIAVTPAAPSIATSEVSVSSGTVASGTTSTITLQARDAAGNTVTVGGATVTFGLGTGTSAGTIGPVTDNTNGTYTATFTGSTAGTARTITATLNGAAVTTTLPTITVTAGAISTSQSVVSVPASYVAVSGAITLTLTARDAAGNPLTSGGSAVAFTATGGSSTGTIGMVTDNDNGTYTATFTGTATGTELGIGATIGGAAVTTPKPGLTVYTTGLTLSTDSLPAVATSGQTGAPHLVAIFANGAQRADGLQANVSYTTPGIAACQSSNWLGTPLFDFSSANPVSIVSFTPNATALGVYTCTATVTISSTTPGYEPKSFRVALAVARGSIAQTAVNLVAMGDAGNPDVQSIAPDARVTITNGGRGVVSGVQATVINATRNSDPEPWLTDANLRWEPVIGDPSARTLPATLIVSTNVAPFSAQATIRVTGNGMTPLDIPVQIFFNVEPEVVANPRGLTFTAFAGGPLQQATVLAYNSNRHAEGFNGFVDSLRNYQRTPGPLAPWLTSVVLTPLQAAGMDTASSVAITIDPGALLADSVYTDTVRIRAEKCATQPDPDPCVLEGFRPNDYDLPVKVVVERGLVISAADATMFAAVGSTSVIRDVSISNGGATPISGLSANVGGAPWLSASFVGGTGAPTTLRLTANPAGLVRGTVLNTTVTINASSPAGVPSKSIPVTLRVY